MISISVHKYYKNAQLEASQQDFTNQWVVVHSLSKKVFLNHCIHFRGGKKIVGLAAQHEEVSQVQLNVQISEGLNF